MVAVSYQTIVDEFKPWKPQIENVKSKILRNFYVLRRTRSFIDRNTAVILYNTMIQSYFDYCNVIWSNPLFLKIIFQVWSNSEAMYKFPNCTQFNHWVSDNSR